MNKIPKVHYEELRKGKLNFEIENSAPSLDEVRKYIGYVEPILDKKKKVIGWDAVQFYGGFMVPGNNQSTAEIIGSQAQLLEMVWKLSEEVRKLREDVRKLKK